MRRDRELNSKDEPAETDIEVQQWQIDHIKAAIKQADAGKFISHEEVKKMAARWRGR